MLGAKKCYVRSAKCEVLSHAARARSALASRRPSALHPAPGTQHPVSRTQHSALGTRHALARSTPHPAHRTRSQHAALRTQHPALEAGTQHSALSTPHSKPALSTLRAAGTPSAHEDGVGAKTFTELSAWQLANRLKTAIYEVTARPAVARDVEFCKQVRRSSSSIPANIAEGFAYYRHREFARYVSIARGSLMETQNHLIDANDRGHIHEAEFKTLWELSSQAMGAVTGLLKYLQRT